MAILAGCPKALRMSAISLVSAEKPIVFVIPISQYYDMFFKQPKFQVEKNLVKSCQLFCALSGLFVVHQKVLTFT
jgi:hypothetical protein